LSRDFLTGAKQQHPTGEVTTMMRALEPEMLDLVYRLVSDRIPPPPEHRYGGCRKRVPNQACFLGLFIRFITGCAWETSERLLAIIGGITVSDTTLRSRRNEWVQAGVFDQLMEDCLAVYDSCVGIDMGDVAIDGSIQLAPGGGPDTNNAPGSKGRKTMKFHIGVDANGIGLGALITSGSANDYPLLEPTLDLICQRDATSVIGTLHLDRGYGYPSLSTKLDGRLIDHVDVTMRNKRGQGRTALTGLKRRWVVERTNAWLTNFRQLKINWDRTIEHRLAAAQLAFAILILYRIADHHRQHGISLESIR
jgi:transposase